MFEKWKRPQMLVVWAVGPALPVGLMVASGVCFSTTRIPNPQAQYAAWISVLILGILATLLIFHVFRRPHQYIFEASSHVGSGYARFLFGVTLVLLTALTITSWFLGFFVVHPRLEGTKWRLAWGLCLMAILVLYAACVLWDMHVQRQTDPEWSSEGPLAWSLFSTTQLPHARQRELSVRGLGSFYHLHMDHTTNNHAQPSSFHQGEYRDTGEMMAHTIRRDMPQWVGPNPPQQTYAHWNAGSRHAQNEQSVTWNILGHYIHSGSGFLLVHL